MKNKMREQKFNIKSFSIKSILERYLSGEYVKLNSIRNTLQREKYPNKAGYKDTTSHNTGSIQIPVKTGDVDLGVKLNLKIIDCLKSANMLKWFEDFENVVLRTGWNEDQQKCLLMDAIVDSLVDKNKFTNNYEENRKYILGLVFPPQYTNTLLIKAQNFKQINFVYIEDYYKCLKEELDLYSLNAACSRSEYDRRLGEIFQLGLGPRTKGFLINSNVKTVHKMLEELNRIELEVLNGYNLPGGVNISSNLSYKDDKWCKFHKVNGHDTKECRINKLKAQKNESNSNKSSSSYLMFEPKFKLNIVSLYLLVNKICKKEVIIDTGSRMNFISKECAEKLKLTPKEDRGWLI